MKHNKNKGKYIKADLEYYTVGDVIPSGSFARIKSREWYDNQDKVFSGLFSGKFDNVTNTIIPQIVQENLGKVILIRDASTIKRIFYVEGNYFEARELIYRCRIMSDINKYRGVDWEIPAWCIDCKKND